MVKRVKKLKRGIESLKRAIEEHFKKIDKEINEKDEVLARYRIKEIDKSLVTNLEHKLRLLEMNNENLKLIKKYKNRLYDYKKKLNISRMSLMRIKVNTIIKIKKQNFYKTLPI